MRAQKKILEKLKEYTARGITKEVLYANDKMCIFNYGDISYIGVPYALYNGIYPVGMALPASIVENMALDENLFIETFFDMLKNNPRSLAHLSEENINAYEKALKNAKNNNVYQMDPIVTEKLKSYNNKNFEKTNERRL